MWINPVYFKFEVLKMIKDMMDIAMIGGTTMLLYILVGWAAALPFLVGYVGLVVLLQFIEHMLIVQQQPMMAFEMSDDEAEKEEDDD